ncbi:UbiA family prenyltransferase [Fusibacter paucivorans]|uniref:UbiA family prenyltransferase n=1 Tax=Fusibacter paucivorans TaxID=76009 RepID=A0ABS5PLM2_9FIRM|nr:UbiA family prenyltransferase [Fusibacter paucivorans]MBS7526065.1 UbiA family prenyltransferase [Fusibacter paucivorans]
MLKNILDFVEIRTKLASVLPMFIGIFYALKLGFSLKPLNFILLLISLLFIDMTTTGLNNYFDAKKAILKHGYHYDEHNPITAGKLSAAFCRHLLIAFAFIAAIAGIGLVLASHWLIFLFGAISFAVAVGYSMGPLPISRTPFGEIFSGLFMGLLIPIISGFSMIPIDHILKANFHGTMLSLVINLQLVLQFFAIGLPLACLIANIMLSNNLCDADEDIVNGRYTLPVVIGRDKALKLYRFLFHTAYALLLILIILRILPLTTLAVVGTWYFTSTLMRTFVKSPSKALTFVNSVKIFFIFASVYASALLINLILKHLIL